MLISAVTLRCADDSQSSSRTSTVGVWDKSSTGSVGTTFSYVASWLSGESKYCCWSKGSGSSSVSTDVVISASLIAVHDVEGFTSKSQG